MPVQRAYFHFHNKRQIVRGIFYPHGEGNPRVLRKLFTFKELEIDAAGKPITGRGRLTAKRRLALLKQRWGEVNREVMREPKKKEEKPTVGIALKEALQAWLDWAATSRAPETVLLMRLAADGFIASLPVKKRTMGLNESTLLHGDAWVKAMYKRGLAPATINLRIRTINAFFGWAIKRSMLEKTLVIQAIRVQRKLPKILTDEEIQTLFERISHLSQHDPDPRHRRFYHLHLRFLTMAHYTGARRQEIFYLPWANISLNEGVIYIRSHSLFNVKEGREKALPIAPALQGFLQAERVASPQEVWLLDNRQGELAYASPDALTLAMRKHMAALGLAGKGIKPLHGHRAAMAHRLWSSGVDLSTVQAALGHSDITVTQGYLPSTTAVVRAAFAGMKEIGVQKILQKTDTKTDTKGLT